MLCGFHVYSKVIHLYIHMEMYHLNLRIVIDFSIIFAPFPQELLKSLHYNCVGGVCVTLPLEREKKSFIKCFLLFSPSIVLTGTIVFSTKVLTNLKISLSLIITDGIDAPSGMDMIAEIWMEKPVRHLYSDLRLCLQQ